MIARECRRVHLRLRPDVYDLIAERAAANFRSITAEINEMLFDATFGEREREQQRAAADRYPQPKIVLDRMDRSY